MKDQEFIRKVAYHLYAFLPQKQLTPSDEPIDVIIPILQKDFKILPLSLKGIRKCVVNRVKNIYIVSPKDELIMNFCEQEKLIFVDENSLFDFSPCEMHLTVENGKRDRSGWLFQQFIKLSGKIGTCDNYLCIDADHILLRPHVFLSQGNIPIFYKSQEYHKPYTDIITRLIGLRKFSLLSYVAHKMLFNKKNLADLRQCIEQDSNGESWTQIIIDKYDKTEGSAFSEFQLYGHYVKDKIERPWLHKGLPYTRIDTYENLSLQYSKHYASITFPDWINKK